MYPSIHPSTHLPTKQTSNRHAVGLSLLEVGSWRLRVERRRRWWRWWWRRTRTQLERMDSRGLFSRPCGERKNDFESRCGKLDSYLMLLYGLVSVRAKQGTTNRNRINVYTYRYTPRDSGGQGGLLRLLSVSAFGVRSILNLLRRANARKTLRLLFLCL